MVEHYNLPGISDYEAGKMAGVSDYEAGKMAMLSEIREYLENRARGEDKGGDHIVKAMVTMIVRKEQASLAPLEHITDEQANKLLQLITLSTTAHVKYHEAAASRYECDANLKKFIEELRLS